MKDDTTKTVVTVIGVVLLSCGGIVGACGSSAIQESFGLFALAYAAPFVLFLAHLLMLIFGITCVRTGYKKPSLASGVWGYCLLSSFLAGTMTFLSMPYAGP